MSSSFRGGNTGKEGKDTINLNDEPLESQAEHPPALKLSIGLAEIIFGALTNCVQVTTSTIAILSMIFSAMTLQGALTSGKLLAVFPWQVVIAFVIAAAIQLFLHKNAQSMSGTWHRLRHIQHFNIKSTQSLNDVQNAITFNTLYFILALAADIISDATFINLFTRNPYVIVGWMVFLTGSSTLLFYDGATRIWGALEDWKDYRAYHRKHDAE